MAASLPQKVTHLMDRRTQAQPERPELLERRQFRDSHSDHNPEVRELAEAIDQYKMANRRRFITVDELLQVIQGLGYHK